MLKKDIDFALLFYDLKDSRIHTHFMRFDIDVYFLDRDKVIFEKTMLKPWKLYKPKKQATYLLETKKHTFTEEERISFGNQGVRGIITVVKNPELESQMKEICTSIHEQQSVIRLAKENKVVSFETAQRLSEDEKTAEIILFDFKLRTAVDSQDSQSILNNISKPDVSFNQVIGAEDAKQELAYFVEYLKDPKKYVF